MGLIRGYTYRFNVGGRARERNYEQGVFRVGDFTLELTVSPTGRSKQVFINGQKVWPQAKPTQGATP